MKKNHGSYDNKVIVDIQTDDIKKKFNNLNS